LLFIAGNGLPRQIICREPPHCSIEDDGASKGDAVPIEACHRATNHTSSRHVRPAAIALPLQFHTGTRQEAMRRVKKRARSADIDDGDGVSRAHASSV
jgi:hypothetical protein